ncbi:hypothetical protein SERLA73DRAFT_151750 [Serpula lacrymans var. lacrymans S7.3]|uniref:Uncharacterized protein n=1 Tax=Serpula lacrymans var. lacrymans (strain S7.3) TaxID=936435 RepID=F8PS70_SERL3|nr:hypothetical protein SERLA73DRAFT_151750 [Serpula lacrymans var. lacrymans S7.3]
MTHVCVGINMLSLETSWYKAPRNEGEAWLPRITSDSVMRSEINPKQLEVMSPADNIDNKESLGVPKPEPDGSNWSMYKTRLEWTLADKECIEHLLETAPKLSPPPPLPGGMAQTISQAQHEALATWTKKEFCCHAPKFIGSMDRCQE